MRYVVQSWVLRTLTRYTQVSLRAVLSTDFMTGILLPWRSLCGLTITDTFLIAKPWDMPRDFEERVSSRITNEVEGVTRVMYDITPKPPGKLLPVEFSPSPFLFSFPSLPDINAELFIGTNSGDRYDRARVIDDCSA